MAPRFAEADLKRPLHLAFTYDEEVGCLGGRANWSEELQKSSFKPARRDRRRAVLDAGYRGPQGLLRIHNRFHRPGGACLAARSRRQCRRICESLHPPAAGAGRGVERAVAPEGSRYEPPWTTVQVGRIQGGMASNVVAGHCEVEWEMRTGRPGDADHVWSRMRPLVEDELKPAKCATLPEADIVTHVIGEVEGLQVVPHSEAFQLVSN
jgi:acetylornithine deacetylase